MINCIIYKYNMASKIYNLHQSFLNSNSLQKQVKNQEIDLLMPTMNRVFSLPKDQTF